MKKLTESQDTNENAKDYVGSGLTTSFKAFCKDSDNKTVPMSKLESAFKEAVTWWLKNELSDLGSKLDNKR